MTQQEQQLLNGLIERVNGTQLPNKDNEAERLLAGTLGTNPDALYILCQTVLVQQFAIDNTQRQLTEARGELDRLKQAGDKPEEHGSFLGNLFGLGKSDNDRQPSPPPQNGLANQPGSSSVPGGYVPVHNPGAPQYGAPQPPAVQPGYGYGQQQGYGGGVPTDSGMFGRGGGMFGGGGGFLQGAMQTAAGVVAGQFAFRALEDVFHSFGGGGERGFSGGSDLVNNDYSNDGGSSGESGGFSDRLRDADGLGSGLSPDIEDRRGESQGFFGSADDNSNDGDGFASSDDDGGFDSGDADGNNDNGF